jgi:hypothetical protein
MFGVFLIAASHSAVQFAADFNFRILNRTGWSGSKTTFDGCSSFAVLLDLSTDLDSFFANPRTRPEVLIIPLPLITKANVERI